MRRRILISCVVISWFSTITDSVCGPRDVAINVTRLGGNSVLAQPYVDRFLRYVEGAAAWAPSSMQGSFLVNKRQVLEYVARNSPGIGIMEPPLYFEFRKAWQLQPILQTESQDLVSERLHLVVKDARFRTIADLRGKRLWTMLAEYPRYLSKVVLGGQVDAATHFTVGGIGKAMKGARGVLRGDCEATLLDDQQLAEARKIEGGSALRSIYTSHTLPPLPVVVFGTGLKPADRDLLARALTEMCNSPKGGGICRKMHIGRFAPLNAALFDSLQKLYGE